MCRSAGERSVARVSTDQGTARIPRELKLPRGSGLCELYPIRAERRRAVNIPIAPLSLSPRRPPLRSAVRTVHRPGLSRAVCYQRSQTPMEKRRGACFTTLPKRKTWGEKVEKLALLLIKLHLTETSSVLKRR